MELGLRLTLITIGILILLGVVWDYQRRKKRVRLEMEHWEQLDDRPEPSADDDLDGWDGRVEIYDEVLDEPVTLGEVRLISRGRPAPRSASQERPHVEPRLDPHLEESDLDEPWSEPRLSPAPRPAAARVRVPEPAPEPEEELPAIHAEEPEEVAEEPPRPAAESGPHKRRNLFGRPKEEPAEPAPPPGPEEVFALHVVAAREPFPGPELFTAFRASGLSHGRFDIFHYVPASGGEPLFSVANMVKPGTFDPASMETFSSPGLAMFMALPGPKDPRAAFEAMLSVARRLAEELGGELRDDRRNVLTGQTVQSYRDRIGEFERTHLNRH